VLSAPQRHRTPRSEQSATRRRENCGQTCSRGVNRADQYYRHTHAGQQEGTVNSIECATTERNWRAYCFFSTFHGRLPQEAVFIDPDAEMGERILPVMLTPPLPPEENSPLATTGGGSSVRPGAVTIPQCSPARHGEHEKLTTRLSRIDSTRRAYSCDPGGANKSWAHPCQSPLKSSVPGDAYVNTLLAIWPSVLVTTTSTVPAWWAGIDK